MKFIYQECPNHFESSSSLDLSDLKSELGTLSQEIEMHEDACLERQDYHPFYTEQNREFEALKMAGTQSIIDNFVVYRNTYAEQEIALLELTENISDDPFHNFITAPFVGEERRENRLEAQRVMQQLEMTTARIGGQITAIALRQNQMLESDFNTIMNAMTATYEKALERLVMMRANLGKEADESYLSNPYYAERYVTELILMQSTPHEALAKAMDLLSMVNERNAWSNLEEEAYLRLRDAVVPILLQQAELLLLDSSYEELPTTAEEKIRFKQDQYAGFITTVVRFFTGRTPGPAENLNDTMRKGVTTYFEAPLEQAFDLQRMTMTYAVHDPEAVNTPVSLLTRLERVQSEAHEVMDQLQHVSFPNEAEEQKYVNAVARTEALNHARTWLENSHTNQDLNPLNVVQQIFMCENIVHMCVNNEPLNPERLDSLLSAEEKADLAAWVLSAKQVTLNLIHDKAPNSIQLREETGYIFPSEYQQDAFNLYKGVYGAGWDWADEEMIQLRATAEVAAIIATAAFATWATAGLLGPLMGATLAMQLTSMGVGVLAGVSHGMANEGVDSIGEYMNKSAGYAMLSAGGASAGSIIKFTRMFPGVLTAAEIQAAQTGTLMIAAGSLTNEALNDQPHQARIEDADNSTIQNPAEFFEEIDVGGL